VRTLRIISASSCKTLHTVRHLGGPPRIDTGSVLPNSIERQGISNRSNRAPSLARARSPVPTRTKTGPSFAQQLYASAFDKPALPTANDQVNSAANSTSYASTATGNSERISSRTSSFSSVPPSPSPSPIGVVATPPTVGRRDLSPITALREQRSGRTSNGSNTLPTPSSSPKQPPLVTTERRQTSTHYSSRLEVPPPEKHSSAVSLYNSSVAPTNIQRNPSGRNVHRSSSDGTDNRAQAHLVSERQHSSTIQPTTRDSSSSPLQTYSPIASPSSSLVSPSLHSAIPSPFPPTAPLVQSPPMPESHSVPSFTGLPSPPMSHPTSPMASLPPPPIYDAQPVTSHATSSTTIVTKQGQPGSTGRGIGTNIMAGLAGGAIGLMGAAVLTETLNGGGNDMDSLVDGITNMTTNSDGTGGGGLIDSLPSFVGGDTASQASSGDQQYPDTGIFPSPDDTTSNYFQGQAYEQSSGQQDQTTNLHHLIHEAYQQVHHLSASHTNSPHHHQQPHSAVANPSHSYLSPGTGSSQPAPYQPRNPSGHHVQPTVQIPSNDLQVGAASPPHVSHPNPTSPHHPHATTHPTMHHNASHHPVGMHHPITGQPLMHNSSYQNYAANTPNHAPIHQTSNWQATPTNQPAYYNGASALQAPVQHAAPLAGQHTAPHPHTQSTGLSAAHIGGLVKGAAVVGGLVMGMVNNSD
jgi:hypothetical protein